MKAPPPPSPSPSSFRDRLRRAWRLFATFLKIGGFTFGGGIAMLPLVEREVVVARGWATHAEVLDMFAIAQAAPGVIAVNTATFVGFRVGGFLGAVAAVLGVALPSVAVLCVVAVFFGRIREVAWMSHAFTGVRAAVLVLILSAMRRLARPLRATAFNFAAGCAAFAAAAFLRAGAFWIILAAVAAGLLADAVGRGGRGHA